MTNVWSVRQVSFTGGYPESVACQPHALTWTWIFDQTLTSFNGFKSWSFNVLFQRMQDWWYIFCGSSSFSKQNSSRKIVFHQQLTLFHKYLSLIFRHWNSLTCACTILLSTHEHENIYTVHDCVSVFSFSQCIWRTINLIWFTLINWQYLV